MQQCGVVYKITSTTGIRQRERKRQTSLDLLLARSCRGKVGLELVGGSFVVLGLSLLLGELLLSGLVLSERARLPGRCLGQEQGIDSLDRKTSGFGNTKEDENSGSQQETSPNKGDLCSNLFLNNGGDKGDDGVHSPVGSSRQRDTLGGKTLREDLGGNDPSNGTDGGSETGNEDGRKGNQGFTSSLLTGKSSRDGSDNDLGRTHDDGTNEKGRSSAHLVDSDNTGERHSDVDGGQDDNVDKGVVNLGVLGKDGTERKVKVDTGKLLTDLDQTTNHGPPQNSVLHAENVGVARVSVLHVLLQLDSNLLEFNRDFLIFNGKASQVGQVLPGVIPSSLFSQESG